MNKTLKIVAGILVSSVCLLFVFRGFDFDQLKTALAEASYGWILPAALIFVTSACLRSLRWKIMLSPIKRIPFFHVFPVLVFGFFMNNVLPARGGEIVRAVTMGRTTRVPTGSVLGSIVAERLTDMVGLLLIIFLSAHLLPWEKLPLRPILTVFAAGIVVCGILLAIHKQHLRQHRTSSAIDKVFEQISHVVAGLLALKSYLKVGAVCLLSCWIWIDELLTVFFISRAMHLDLSFFQSAGVLTGLSVGVMIPAAPGYIGTYEFFGNEALKLLGILTPGNLPFLLVLHFFQLSMMAIVAVPCIFVLRGEAPLELNPEAPALR